MSRSGASAAAAQSRASMSIGEVLDQLRAEFPDTTISKLRYLESEGLVDPDRTAAGYRKFSAADVDRLRYVLTAQRDHYLPLRVIRERLDAIDRGEQPPGPGPTPGENWLSDWNRDDEAAQPAADEPLRLSRTELTECTGLSEAVLREVEGYGLLAARNGYYDNDMVRVARMLVELTRYGLEPRHLRTFRSTADREVGLLQQALGPALRQRDQQARDRAQESLTELAELSIQLHAALVRTAVRNPPER